MSSLLLILLSAVLTSVVVLEHVPQWRPFAAVVDLFEGTLLLALAVLVALPLSTVVAYLLSHGVLIPQRLDHLRTPSFFAVVVLVTSIVEAAFRRFGSRVPTRPGFPLLVITNCAI